MNAPMFPGRPNRPQKKNGSTVPAGVLVDATNQKQSKRRDGQLPNVCSIGQKLSPKSQVEQDRLLRRQALDSAQQGRYQEAIALMTCLIDRNPTNASDFNNRGLLHFRSGYPIAALADYDRALQLNPRLAKVYNNRANCYAALGQLAEAIADYETAIDLDPANIRAWINQGITFRDLEMYSQALENFELALQFNQILAESDDPDSNFLEGHIYAERGRTNHLAGDWNWAIADYQRALLKLPPIDSLTCKESQRLRLKVESWLDDLLKPLVEGNWEEDVEL